MNSSNLKRETSIGNNNGGDDGTTTTDGKPLSSLRDRGSGSTPPTTGVDPVSLVGGCGNPVFCPEYPYNKRNFG